MPQDDLDHIPAIIPTRDSEHRSAGARTNAPKSGGSAGRRPGGEGVAATGGGSGILTRLVLAAALGVAAVACAWAWQLQQELAQASEQMQDYSKRIGDLEDRLSDTDEGMSQNAEVQAAKIRELDTEVRKLWDNVWKQASARLDKLESQDTSQAKTLASNQKAVTDAQAQLQGAAADIAKLKAVAGDLEGLMAKARTSQAEVERVADSLNRINLDLAKLNKRVQSNEEWIGPINTFRKQVNANIVELQASLRALQARP